MVSPVAVAVVLAILVAALAGMALSWRLRGRRQRGYVLPAAPAEPGTVLAEADGLYLATTFADRPLDRVVAAGLGFRARCRVAVTERGLLVDRDGVAPLLLAATGAGTATWTIDRAVEREGLLVVGWSLPTATGDAEDVESSFRFDATGQARLLAALPRPAEVPRADGPF